MCKSQEKGKNQKNPKNLCQKVKEFICQKVKEFRCKHKIVFGIIVTIVIIFLIILGVLFIAAVPWLLDLFVFGNNMHSALSNGEWSGFLGSYIGGVAGGVGTLIAVYKSTSQVKRYEEKRENDEITENALVIYYDMKFAFCEINKKLSIVNGQLGISDEKLENVFIDENWIHTVAKIAPSLEPNSPNSIEQLYNLYGHINELKRLDNLRKGQSIITEFFYTNEMQMVQSSKDAFTALAGLLPKNGNTDFIQDCAKIPGYEKPLCDSNNSTDTCKPEQQ